MLFEIRHETKFRYDKPVFFEPLTIRLRPRSDPAQRLLDHRLTVSPRPDGMCDCIDLEGSPSVVAWFSGLHAELSLTATSRVETLRSDPFAYILTGERTERIPAAYDPPYRSALGVHLRRPERPAGVREFARQIAEAVDWETLPFLSQLAHRIHADFETEIREIGEPLPASITERRRKGACRDFALLYMEACREMGVAARFVSGYADDDTEPVQRHLHAWVEVYLPGGGWRGYDPTLGLAVADRHVALAAAYRANMAAPTSGVFRGTGAEASIEYSIASAVR